MGNSCCCCGDKEAKLRRAEEDKRAAEDAKRYREEIEIKTICASLEEEIRRLYQKVEDTQKEISEMYDQIKGVLKDNKQEDAKTLPYSIVRREQYLMELQTYLSFFNKLANEIEIVQSRSNMIKIIERINGCLAKQSSDTLKLTELLIQNRVLLGEKSI